jgi:hypothetical protein
MPDRLRRSAPVLVLAAIAVVAAVVCGVAARAAGPLNPVASWARPAGRDFVATKSQYESMLTAAHVAESAAVIVVVAVLAAVVVAVVTRRRSRA